METVGAEIHKIPGHREPIVRVSPKSPIREVMKIGHSNTISMTILSNSFFDETMDLHVYDVAGYNDTRGFEINISNNVNMRAILKNAKSLKVVLLVTYQSLSDGRGRGFTEMLEMSYQVFGGKEELLKNKASFFLSVTKCPDYVTLEDVKDYFTTDQTDDIKELADRVIILDVLDRQIKVVGTELDSSQRFAS